MSTVLFSNFHSNVNLFEVLKTKLRTESPDQEIENLVLILKGALNVSKTEHEDSRKSHTLYYNDQIDSNFHGKNLKETAKSIIRNEPELLNKAFNIINHGRCISFVDFEGGFSIPNDGKFAKVIQENCCGDIFQNVLESVGRILISNIAIGSGWLIGEKVVVTTRKIATQFIGNSSDSKMTIDFSACKSQECRIETIITKCLYMDKQFDFAFCEIGSFIDKTINLKPISCETGETGKIQENKLVATIGYAIPNLPSSHYPILVKELLDDILPDLKRIMFGELIHESKNILQHDCATFFGCQGSLVFDLNKMKAIGLHLNGELLSGNYTIPTFHIFRAYCNLINKQ